jgi:hypothetical protein
MQYRLVPELQSFAMIAEEAKMTEFSAVHYVGANIMFSLSQF